MQARPKIVQIFVVALIVSLVLGACGGGTTGNTWFNLPSTPVRVQPDGTARVYGFNVGYILNPALIQQLQSADIQELEVRIGYNGIHVYNNGQQLPFVKWDQDSVETLQAIIPALGIPNGDMIVSALPWLRTIGLGVKLDLPLAQGSTALDIPNWSGETDVASESPDELALGPITIGSLTFDPEGNASIEGVPLSVLEQALGTSIPLTLDPTTRSILEAGGGDAIIVSIHPNGIDLSLGDNPLPGLAYDTKSLENMMGVLPAFVPDPATLDTVSQVVPMLTATDVTLAVSLTGEQAAETRLTPIAVTLTPEGDIQLLGLPVASGLLDPALVADLQAAGIQRLTVNLTPNGLYLAANDQLLPSITWDEASLDTVVSIAGPLTGLGEDGLNSILEIATSIGPNVAISIPPAEGAQELTFSEAGELATEFAPVEPDPQGVTLRITASVDGQGNITGLGGLSAEDLGALGIALPTLPPDVMELLARADANSVQIATDPGALIVRVGGDEALRVAYDAAALEAALNIAVPFAAGTPLTDPTIDMLLREQILPLVPTADVNITLQLQ